MLHLNITAETPEELKKTLMDLAASLNTATPKNEELSEEISLPGFQPAADTPVQEHRGSDSVAAVDAPPPPLPTMEEARAALNALRQKKGAAAVREVLKKHGVSSFTELDPNDYPQVMKEAVIDG